MSGTIGKPVILVADDDQATRYLMRRTLSHEGFLVREAQDGAQALELFRETSPDLVILDVEMPGLGGYEACRAIRSAAGGTRMPVVMVTSHDDRDSIDRAYEAGATDFIAKPISWPLIGYRMRYILRGARTLQTLGATLEEKRALMAALPDSIFVVDRNGGIVEHLRGDGASAADFAAARPAGRVTEIFPERLHADLLSGIRSVLATGEHCSIECRLTDGRESERWYECRLVDHGNSLALLIVRDISERKSAEQRIHQLAYYDALTGLPNRPQFIERTDRALAGAGCEAAVFLVDLDRFKRINDTLGSDAGDEVLVEIGRRLADTIAPIVGESRAAVTESCLACLGGDVFALMTAGDLAALRVDDLADRLRRSIAAPLAVNGHDFVVTATVGIARSPQHGDSAETLLKNAEAARCEAKSQGKNTQKLYRSSMNAGATECLNIETELRRAIERDELAMWYQPKFSVSAGRIVGAEALLRWFHPRRGEISPAVFVPIAEAAGLMGELGRWTVNRVCQQIAAWRYVGLQPEPVAINLSGQEFVLGDPLQTLTDAVRAAAIEASALELEITETVLMSDIRSVVQTLHSLRESGFSLAVDDFGTGYSSLRYLQRFPIDVLKIDRSFVRDVETNTDSRAICTAIIALAQGLRLTVVGEGVADPWQKDFLVRQGCDVLQGFLLSRPLPADRYAKLLQPAQAGASRAAQAARLSLVTPA